MNFSALFIIITIILFLISHLVNSTAEPRLPRVITPFPAPKLTDLSQVNFNFQFDLVSFISSFFSELDESVRFCCCCSFKVSTRRVCIGELIVPISISEFVPGIIKRAVLFFEYKNSTRRWLCAETEERKNYWKKMKNRIKIHVGHLFKYLFFSVI